MNDSNHIRSNVHTHTQFCDGKSTAREMVEAALACGFVSLGLSSHAPQVLEAEWGMRDEPGYIRHVRALQAEYAGRIRLYLGVEADIEGTIDRAAYDYVIGAVHYVRFDGQYYVVDGLREQLDATFRGFFQRDGLAMARAYYQTVVQAVQDMRPDIIAHFDLLRKYNDADMRFFDTRSPAYRQMALDALEAIADTGVLLEVNTGGVARGYLAVPYPEDFLLEHWQRLGGRVILGSDCHSASRMDFGFEDALARIRAAGFRSVVRLSAGAGVFEEVALP